MLENRTKASFMAKNGKKPKKYDNLGVFTINRGGNKSFLPFYYLECEERGETKKLTERFPAHPETIFRSASSR